MTTVIDLLASLNEQQQQAVKHQTGTAVVLAGAGSGKTRVLTTRVAWLITQQHVDPHHILLVTFTNKAAQEMKRRVVELTGQHLTYSGTFHRICVQILRHHGQLVGLHDQFSIYDTQDQEQLIKQIYKTHGFDHKQYHPKSVKAAISKAKNDLITAEQFADEAVTSFEEQTARIYKLYQQQLSHFQAVDFDDLLMKVVELFQQQPAVLETYQTQLQYLLVDEYQDTNKAQYQLTKLLAKPRQNLFVVGDFSQSIYAWRGADYRNLEYLYQDFNPITEYRLERNYRSTQTILDAATQVISQNTSHPILALWTETGHQAPLEIFENKHGEEEALRVAEEIQRLKTDYRYQDVAILYRINAQSRPFEEIFVKFGIPYRLVGGFKFYERAEVKDLLAYLRLLVNPADSISHDRVLKIGKRRFQAFQSWVDQELGDPDKDIVSYQQKISQLTPLSAMQSIVEQTHYLDRFDPHDPQDQARIENVQEMLNVAGQFQEIPIFLENVALVQDNQLADVDTQNTNNAVTLMSLHAAKGLEFPVVFMVGMEEGLLPHSRSLFDAHQLEEERRLCYVGITRAKEKLYFSYARQRWQQGQSSYCTRSRFLNDIDVGLFAQAVTPVAPYGERRLVMDDSILDSVLSGELDLDAFIDM